MSKINKILYKFRHFILKFNYAVEIGANMAYIGHYKATKDPEILRIANDELGHQTYISIVLSTYGEKPSKHLNSIFKVIGFVIQKLCMVSPEFLLDFVAISLEKFAFVSYETISRLYPEYRNLFIEMSENEEEHEHYFKLSKKERIKYVLRKGEHDLVRSN